jgi:adenosylcobinamide-GDP ribazoletransferase
LALTFLTILPWPRPVVAGPEELARSLIWFPWVGLLLGGLYAALGGLALRFWPPAGAAALLLTLTVLLTRGLHLDGLADTLDGLGGGRDRDSRLAVMKDSRLGAFGALGLVLALLLKGVFLAVLLAAGRFAAVLLFPAVSRAGMVLLAWLSPYARPEGGLGQAMTEGVTPRIVLGALGPVLLWGLMLAGLRGLVLLGAAAVVVLALSRLFTRLLGGITGDVLGAVNELVEILALALLSAG